MHGLFLSEIDPPAIGHNFWTAFKNQRLTSSGVSLFGIVQVLYYTCTNHSSILLLRLRGEMDHTIDLAAVHVGYARPNGAFHLHFLTPYGSFLNLVSHYPSARVPLVQAPAGGL
jgi:hypothetical protein